MISLHVTVCVLFEFVVGITVTVLLQVSIQTYSILIQ